VDAREQSCRASSNPAQGNFRLGEDPCGIRVGNSAARALSRQVASDSSKRAAKLNDNQGERPSKLVPWNTPLVRAWRLKESFLLFWAHHQPLRAAQHPRKCMNSAPRLRLVGTIRRKRQ